MSAPLSFASVSLSTASARFRVTEGGPGDEDWEVRGSDDVVSPTVGRTIRNRVNDSLAVIVEGWIVGQGATIDAQRQNYQATLNTLQTVLQTDNLPAQLVWEAPDGVLYEITVRFVRKSRGEWVNGVLREFTLEFECVDTTGWTTV
jgi:hypothetical protein